MENQIIEKALDKIRSTRFPSFATRADVRRIDAARKSGDWSAVHGSALYRLHGGEYCELLQYIPMDVTTEAKRHLRELEAFSMLNPTVAKAITQQRLVKSGHSEYDALQAIDSLFQVAGVIA